MEHYFTNNSELRSEIRSIDYQYDGFLFHFFSDNGVFSKKKIDYGSCSLVETFLEKNEDKINAILDVGCGYGFMGIVLAKILGCNLTLVDVNKRALNLSQENVNKNKINAEILESNVYEKVTKKYDLIITNPPIRAGKKIVLEIVLNAHNYLEEKGCLWVVIRKDQGAKSVIKEMEKIYDINLIKKDRGFYVINAKKKLT